MLAARRFSSLAACVRVSESRPEAGRLQCREGMKIRRMQCLYDEELLQSAHGVAAVDSEKLLGAWPQMADFASGSVRPGAPRDGSEAR